MFQDLFHFPDTGLGDTQVFNVSTTTWQLWRKPKGCSFVYILALAGGGSGGAGFTRAPNGAGGGGGGGGGSATLRLMIPAFLLPEVLHIAVGAGGAPSSNAGQVTVIAVQPAGSGFNLMVAGAPAGGTVGLVGAAGTGGAGGAATTNNLIALGISSTTTGVTGTAGGVQTGAAGVASSFLAGAGPMIAGCGSGGAGCTTTDFAGGVLNSPSGTFIAALPGGAAAGGNGTPGIQVPGMFAFTGGSGGGSNNSGVAGAGGDGAIGSGGGGGGAGQTGGAGGRGGNGIVVIVSL